MFKNFLYFFIFLFFGCHNSKNITPTKICNQIFKKENIQGTFVLYDNDNYTITSYHPQRAQIRFSPASTFKIPHSLIGLYTKAVKNVDEIFFKYNGEKFYLPTWEKDMNLREAIKVSNLEAYKVLSRKIGLKKMQENINRLKYGNLSLGKQVDLFWTKGPLKISAIEQALFLMKLAKTELPYPKNIQKEVQNILLLENNSHWKLFGKTGLTSIKPSIGWFVGWVEKNHSLYSFALNMNMKKSIPWERRISLAKECLISYGL